MEKGAGKRQGGQSAGQSRHESESGHAGLDVEFAKALRDFFRDARDVQNGIKEMRDYGRKDMVCFGLRIWGPGFMT